MLVKLERMPIPEFDGVFNFGKEMDSLFSDFLLPSIVGSASYPSLNIADKGDEILLTAALPGVRKEDLKIAVHDGVLEISGERKATELPEKARWIRSEIASGSFSRSLTLPRDINQDKLAAELKNGILTVVLPKREQAKPREIAIQ